jgi:pyridoxamine 5'-phosphate oxidase
MVPGREVDRAPALPTPSTLRLRHACRSTAGRASHPLHVDLSDYRREYSTRGVDPAEVDSDPIAQFRAWFADAERAGVVEPNAAVIATADRHGRPSCRHVLVKEVGARGFVIYTNAHSRKGRQLAENPFASLCMTWSPISRQVLIEGPVEVVDAATADAYFISRPRGSQIGAWASDQSTPLSSREELESRVEAMDRRFSEHVPRPPHWKGFRVLPERIEFWQGRLDRLHDRVLFRHDGERWVIERLAP